MSRVGDDAVEELLPADVDLLVIGGGPVGVTAAILARHSGMSVRVLEREPLVYDLPRAIVMDDEIQRVFQMVGLDVGLAGITTPLAGAEFVAVDGQRIIGVDLPSSGPFTYGHHPSVTYYQPQLEAFLRAAALDAGVDLQLQVDVTAVDQDEDGVTASAMTPEGEAIHRARWLIAADGASSPIRKGLDIPFLDQGFDQGWLVLDVELRRPVDTLPRCVQQICDPARPTTFVVGHDDYRRWEFQLQPGETSDEMVSPERVWKLLSPWLSPEDARLIRAVVYRFHATVAESVRSKRIFLAGDAAHQMPPFLGQGLCSGVRDAANLIWKLALVQQGLARDALLDTYGQERLPHATGVVANAVDTGILIDQLSGRVVADTSIEAGYGGARPFPHLEQGLLHGDHASVGRQLPQPVINGGRLDDLLGTGFAVLVTQEAVADSVKGRWEAIGGSVVTVPADALAGLLVADGAVIVRPDRQIAAVAADTTELQIATDDLLGRLDPSGRVDSKGR